MSAKEKEKPAEPTSEAGALVPAYSGLEIARGVQAFRRGEIILYTIRGEPEQVQRLLGELEHRNVGEIVALISHRAGDSDRQDFSGDRADDAAEGSE